MIYKRENYKITIINVSDNDIITEDKIKDILEKYLNTKYHITVSELSEA